MKRLYTICLMGIFTLSSPMMPALWAKDTCKDCATDSKEHHLDPKKLQKKLGLSDEQTAKIDGLIQSKKGTIKPLREKQMGLVKKLQQQVDQKASDSDIQATLADLKANRNVMRDQMEQFQSQMQDILTPTQQAKMFLKRMKHRGHRMHGEEAAG